jgi:butyrate kinase
MFYTFAAGVNLMGLRVVSIYPAAFETRAALFEGEREVCRTVARHDQLDIHMAYTPREQFSVRFGALEKPLSSWLREYGSFDAVIGSAVIPGGKETGVYSLDEEFLRRAGYTGRAGLILNQGAIIASRAAHMSASKAFAMVPFLTSEMDVSRGMSGVRGLLFGRMSHIFPIKNALYLAARELGKTPGEVSLVIAYLGENFSFCSHSGGRIRDFSSALERGPFSSSRSGGVPAKAIVRMAYGGQWSRMDLIRMASFESGVKSYTGTGDINEIISRAEAGDAFSSLVFNAMAYQVASEITSHAAVLRGSIDAIVMVGDLATNDYLVNAITERVSWITSRIMIFGEEDGLLTMTRAALRVLNGEETPILCDRPRRKKG